MATPQASRGDDGQPQDYSLHTDALNRRFRDLEARNRSSSEDSVNTIRVQLAKIEKLKMDNDRLKEELAIEARQVKHNLETTGKTAHLSKLQEQQDMFKRKIEIERHRIMELDSQIKKMEDSILQQQADMGGVNASRETSKTIQKNIKLLENRLDKALVKFNEALGQNKKLRTNIDNLRRERVVFDGIYRKLESDLKKTKSEMREIIEVANSAYLSRDASHSEMQRQKEMADREQRLFEHEWRELTKLIDHDRQMQNYLTTKDREKMNDAVVNSVLEQEQQLRKKLSRGAWAIVKDKAHIHIAQEQVEKYRSSFDQIRNATGISEMDNLVGTFIQSEETNFALFNQVARVSSEIERLDDSIKTLSAQVDGQRETPLSASPKKGEKDERKPIIRQLKTQIKQTNDKTQRLRSTYTQSLATLSDLAGGITKILDKLNIDESISDQVRQSGITPSNMTAILSPIEVETNSLLDQLNELLQPPIAKGLVGAHAGTQSHGSFAEASFDDNDANLGVGLGASSLDSLRIVAPTLNETVDYETSEDDTV